MARSRNVKPGFFKNEAVAACSPMARLLFVGLWTLSDREGRMEYRPLKIKAELFPFDSCDVDALITELATVGEGMEPLVVRYESGCSKYLWLPGFRRNQNPHPKEPNSVLPEPPRKTTASRVLQHASNADSLILIPDSPTLIPSPLTPPAAAGSGFAEFWKRWPSGARKKGRSKCEKHWRLNKLDRIADDVMRGLSRWLASEEWAKDGGKFIPGPHPWLNDQAWEAEPKPKRRLLTGAEIAADCAAHAEGSRR